MNFFLCMMMILGVNEAEHPEYRMIRPTVVYDENIDPEDEWLGLFDYATCNRLNHVEMLLTIEDTTVHERDKPAGMTVELPEETHQPLILLSSSPPVLSDGPVLTVIHDYMHLLPNLSILFGERDLEEVRLFTTVDGLFLSNERLQQHITGTYPGIERSETYMGIVWAGDIDRDGKLDLLLNDVRGEQLQYSWDLYLSSEASPDQLVRKVASFQEIFD